VWVTLRPPAIQYDQRHHEDEASKKSIAVQHASIQALTYYHHCYFVVQKAL
jgi:hypothetical protein